MAKLGLETPPFREHPAMPVLFSEQVFFGAFWAASLGERRVESRVVINLWFHSSLPIRNTTSFYASDFSLIEHDPWFERSFALMDFVVLAC